MTDPARLAGFAPSDPTDGRELLGWDTKYPPNARKEIRREAIYLMALLASMPLAMLVLWLEYPRTLLRISDDQYPTLVRYGVAWLGGTLGGVLFALKWLYHSVARQLWHLDRRLWRIFTPHISGGLSFAVVALISSGMFRIFDAQSVNSLSLVVGTAFLVGYFSDSAIAKLSELAATLFGTNPGRIEHSTGVLPPAPNEHGRDNAA